MYDLLPLIGVVLSFVLVCKGNQVLIPYQSVEILSPVDAGLRQIIIEIGGNRLAEMGFKIPGA